MDQVRRIFQLDTEWSVIHLPERPNGFGVFIIGDKNHFVDEDNSYWITNYGRQKIIQYLLSEGYTIFYSNLYGANWGSPRATKLAIQLYHVVMKSEILNQSIHVIAEGMGALVALQLMNKLEHKLRSVALINPCIDLLAHIEFEQEHKFFYKRMVKELANEYNRSEKEIVSDFASIAPKIDLITPNTPVKIWQNMFDKTYESDIHSRKYHELRKNEQKEITLTYLLNEKEYSFYRSLRQFFNDHEKKL